MSLNSKRRSSRRLTSFRKIVIIVVLTFAGVCCATAVLLLYLEKVYAGTTAFIFAAIFIWLAFWFYLFKGEVGNQPLAPITQFLPARGQQAVNNLPSSPAAGIRRKRVASPPNGSKTLPSGGHR
jgi:hypothetical protein